MTNRKRTNRKRTNRKRTNRRRTNRIIRKSNIKRSKITNKKYDLYNGKKWDSYRLGDVILGQFICWETICLNRIADKKISKKMCDHLDFDTSHTNKVNIEWCKKNKEVWADHNNKKESYLNGLHKNFPNSIASKYIKNVGYPGKYKIKDFNVIKKIFNELDYKNPDKSTLVIHLRLGDVLSKKYINDYVYNTEYYKELFEKIKINKFIKKVDIVTGLHKNVFVNASNIRLNKIVKIFSEKYPVKVVITKNPDKDFYYMCHSKFFVGAGGGFSQLVSDYLKYTKGSKLF